MKDYKLVLFVVGIPLAISLISTFLFSAKTGTDIEIDIWKQMSIEAIYSVGKLEEIDKIKTNSINKMAVELKALGIDDVDAILNQYLSPNGN